MKDIWKSFVFDNKNKNKKNNKKKLLLWTECLHNNKIHMLKPNPKGDALGVGLWDMIRSWGWSLHECL